MFLSLKIFFTILINFFLIFIFGIINNKFNMVNGEEYIETPAILEDEEKSKGKFNLGIELIAGTLAGVSSCILFYPLECIEAKLQVMTSSGTNLISNAGKKLNGGGGTTTSTIGNTISPISMAKNIIKTDGIRGLYQGISPTILGNAVNWGVYFSIYRATNHWMNSPDSNGNVYEGPAWVSHSASAITAGIITTAIVNPFWVLKIRLATTKKYNGIIHAFKSILQNEGIGGFWKGVGISFIGVSEGLFQFVSYEYLLTQMRLASLQQGGSPQLSVANYLVAGGTARLIAGCLTYPYLLIRSTLQSETCQYKSMSQAINGIYKSEGIKGFYRGIGPNLSRSIPPAAFMLYIVEFFRNALENL